MREACIHGDWLVSVQEDVGLTVEEVGRGEHLDVDLCPPRRPIDDSGRQTDDRQAAQDGGV